nr:HSP20-like chaperones superfamily protein isoform 1 [Ipomoea batatas]
MLPDAKTPKVSLEPDGVFTLSASAGAENHLYELKLELNDKVNVEESKINIGLRNIFCVLEKAEKQWWNRLLRAEGKPPHYVKVDWDKWADEDEDSGPADFDMGGMDFSKFGNMGGLGGMDFGNGAVGDDFDDSDDEEQEGTDPASEKVAENGQSTEGKVEASTNS